MQSHIGKAIRMSDILAENSLIFDSTIASSIGATEGLEDMVSVVEKLSPIVDGMILNPGQIEHLAMNTGGKNKAAPLVRVDWTNAYRGADFCLPASQIKRVEISNAQDVSDLGSSAAVASLLMGYGDAFEAENIHSISHLIREAYAISIPVLADIRPIGDNVSESNLEETIKLGVSFMMEAGADGLIIPLCSDETLKLIGSWSTVPVLTATETILSKAEFDATMKLGIRGMVFNETILRQDQYDQKIKNLK